MPPRRRCGRAESMAEGRVRRREGGSGKGGMERELGRGAGRRVVRLFPPAPPVLPMPFSRLILAKWMMDSPWPGCGRQGCFSWVW